MREMPLLVAAAADLNDCEGSLHEPLSLIRKHSLQPFRATLDRVVHMHTADRLPLGVRILLLAVC